ncbi:MAG: DUF5666 domain-containing protein [Anaerolineae bacterium]
MRRLTRCKRWVVILQCAILLLIPLSNIARQRPVSAASEPGLLQEGNAHPSSIRRPSVKIVGWINEVRPTYWLIGDRLVYIDPASPMAKVAQAGMYVVVIARQDSAGHLYAENIFLQPQDESPSGINIEFRCLIQEIDPRYWIVCNRMVLIAESTAIQGQPELGALAEVKGIRLFGDTVLARNIKVVVPGAYADVEFEGAIESLSDNVWVVNGITVSINVVTVIQGTPELGLIAEVKGMLQPEGSVLAQSITVKGPGVTPQVDIDGIVEYIGNKYWIVAGTTVYVDARTFIDDSRAPAEVGMRAQVRALRRLDGTLLAQRIRLSRPN